MKMLLEIEFSNDGMQDGRDAFEALTRVAGEINWVTAGSLHGLRAPINDINGNNIGHYRFIGDAPEGTTEAG